MPVLQAGTGTVRKDKNRIRKGEQRMSVIYKCDKCGCVTDEPEIQQEYLHIRRVFGYYSCGLDGVILNISLCPSCAKEMFKDFIKENKE
jgi:hypothetical protein